MKLKICTIFLVVLCFIGCSNSQKKEPPRSERGENPTDTQTDTLGSWDLGEKDPHELEMHLGTSTPPERDPDPPSQRPVNLAPKVPKTKDFEHLLKFQQEIVNERPGNTEELKRLGILYLLAHKYEKAEGILTKIEKRDEFLQLIIAYLYNVLGEHRIARNRLAKILNRWRRWDGICIDRVVLCSAIKGFRNYQVYPDNRFKPGQTILIYVEPRDFMLKNEGQKYTLHLRYNWELFDKDGCKLKITKWEEASSQDKEDLKEFSGPITEFHQNFALPLPKNIAMGKYTLRVTVKDIHSGKLAERSIEIYVTDN
jgi:hypothetical protein